MKYWWVNQNQTYRQEIAGGYMWSPKRKSDGSRNQYYENMRHTNVGDIVFSYYNQQIQNLGIVVDTAESAPKPDSFGSTGEYWGHVGWMVPVVWHRAPVPYRPKDRIEKIRPYLPERYSPLRPNGDGLQNLYLTAISDSLAEVLLEPFGDWGQEIVRAAVDQPMDTTLIADLEDQIQNSIRNNTSIDSTEKDALIKARLGQGKFRQNLESIERSCRLTGVTNRALLRASHIKPWRSCESNAERIDGYNGLLLTPNADHLFDKGWISFLDDGQMLISKTIDPEELRKMGIEVSHPPNVGPFSSEQAAYLAYHRENIFRKDQ